MQVDCMQSLSDEKMLKLFYNIFRKQSFEKKVRDNDKEFSYEFGKID